MVFYWGVVFVCVLGVCMGWNFVDKWFDKIIILWEVEDELGIVYCL